MTTVQLTDGPAAGRLLDVQPGPHGMPNLIDVPVPKRDPGAATDACVKERYARMWCPGARPDQPVRYHHLAPSPDPES
jgi:hypothetical protein